MGRWASEEIRRPGCPGSYKVTGILKQMARSGNGRYAVEATILTSDSPESCRLSSLQAWNDAALSGILDL